MVTKMTYMNKGRDAILFYIWNNGTTEYWNIGSFFCISFISIMIHEIKQSWIENALIEFLLGEAPDLNPFP